MCVRFMTRVLISCFVLFVLVWWPYTISVHVEVEGLEFRPGHKPGLMVIWLIVAGAVQFNPKLYNDITRPTRTAQLES